MRTRLGLSGFARSLYGSFAGKAEATGRIIGTVTRLGVSGVTRPLYGSFDGKGAVISQPRTIGTVTRLGVSGVTRPLYGSFAGKGGTVEEFIPKGPFIANIGTMMR